MAPWTLSDIERAFRASWAADTCSPDDVERTAWQPDNPAWGHCDITALLLSHILGGNLIVGEVYSGGGQHGYHWWNRLSGGLEVDLTREQFRHGQIVTAQRVVKRPDGRPARRYEEFRLLRSRVSAHLGPLPCVPGDEALLVGLIRSNTWLLRVLTAVREAHLPDAWVGAGALRDLVWGTRYGSGFSPELVRDVDVAFFDPSDLSRGNDDRVTERLSRRLPGVPWEARNQAAVHAWYHVKFGGDPVEPLTSMHDALATWPETATAVAIRLSPDDMIEINAPFGLDDLLDGVWRRNPRRISLDRSLSRLERQDQQAAQSAAGEAKVITLCGSTRFEAEFAEVNQQLTMEGCVVISLGMFSLPDLPDYDWTVDSSDLKVRLGGVHFQKIRMADEVYIVDPGGYLGESTRREIAYAESLGKPVRYLSRERLARKGDGPQE